MTPILDTHDHVLAYLRSAGWHPAYHPGDRAQSAPFIAMYEELEALRAYKRGREQADTAIQPGSMEGVRLYISETCVQHQQHVERLHRERRSHRRHIRTLQKALTREMARLQALYRQLATARRPEIE